MDSATQILNIAERRMRTSGYNAVSYRDIAAEMGIKSASLHYHFPKKADLGTALVRRYSESLFAKLQNETKDTTDPSVMIGAFVNICRNAVTHQRLICLCAVFGAEAQGLPENVAAQVNLYYLKSIDWLATRYIDMGRSPAEADVAAKAAFSLLEGAMIVSSVNNDISIFEAAATTVSRL